MTTLIKNQTFRGLRFGDRDSGHVFADIEFDHCHFESIALSITTVPEHRSVIRNVRLVNCSEKGSHLWPAVVEDVTVDGLKTGALLIANACAYKHVVLRGKIGNVKICRSLPALTSVSRDGLTARQAAMDRANAEYYRSVDWALDISQAEFASCEIEGVPPDLVRRDPATQFILRRDALKARRWRDVDLSRTYWGQLLNAYDSEDMDDVILVAPRAARDFAVLLQGLKALNAAGIIEA